MQIEFSSFEGLPYILHYPQGYESGKRYPVLLQLHGAGTRGISIEQYSNVATFPTLLGAANEPFVILSPHCTKSSWFDLFETLIRFAGSIASMPFTDPERIYLMGTSMGAYAAWQLAMSQPQLFAAMVPICGGGMYWSASRLVNIPIWAFHGGKDTTVFPEESVKMVDKVNAKGGNARLTIYPDNAHDAWSDTYSNPEVFAWMFSHRNTNAKDLSDACQGRDLYG